MEIERQRRRKRDKERRIQNEREKRKEIEKLLSTCKLERWPGPRHCVLHGLRET